MLYFIIKVVLSALLIGVISEVAKRSTGLGGFLASLPLISLLAMIWLYVDTRDAEEVAQLSFNIFWLALPSLPMFLLLPLLVRKGLGFYPALGLSLLVVACGYFVVIALLKRFSVPGF